MISVAEIDGLLATVLRGEAPTWPGGKEADEDSGATFRRALFHGIAGLLTERSSQLEGWPEELISWLRQHALAQAMWELAHRQALVPLLEKLAAEGVEVLIMKGTALAYSLYETPAMRLRGDTDMLVRKSDLDRSRAIFAALGWTRMRSTHGAFGDLHYQEIWQQAGTGGDTHDIDLHWHVINSQALSSLLDVEDCFARSVPLPRLSPAARATDPVTRLIHGCINQASHERGGHFSWDRHYYDGERLIWAWDYDLQARALSAGEWQEFVEKSLASGIGSICHDGLGFARKSLGTQIPADVMGALARAPRETQATRYLRQAGGFARGLADWWATPGLGDKLGFLLARAFPSPELLRAKYPKQSSWPVAFLYLRRQVEALARFGRKSAG